MALRSRFLSLLPALIAFAAVTAAAQTYPSRTIEFVVHTAPGGGTDRFACVVTDILQKEKILSQPLLAANRLA